VTTTFRGLLVAAVLLALAPSCDKHGEGADHEEALRKYNASVAKEQAELVKLASPGTAPLRALQPMMAVGETLVADVDSVATSKVWGDGPGDPPAMTRTTQVHATVTLHAEPPKLGDQAYISLEISKLTGDVKHLDVVPHHGHIEPGAYGEPWVFVMSYGEADAHDPDENERLIWEHDVAGWARRILSPLPTDPIGAGASWTRTYTDYMGYDPIVEHDTFELASIDDNTMTISARAASSSNATGGSGDGTSSARITLPLGPRAVPTGDWLATGKAAIQDHGSTTHIETTATLSIRPHGSPKPAAPIVPMTPVDSKK
jgi:hypothetical protein